MMLRTAIDEANEACTPTSRESPVYLLKTIAGVPKRSPFRYPGGKTWLIPFLRPWLDHLRHQGKHITSLVEPFAGGGSVSLAAVFDGLVECAVLVELDKGVGAVWETVIGGRAEELASRIQRYELTAAAVESTLAESSSDTVDLAFRTILRNRVNYGGIMASRTGRLKRGETLANKNAKGLHSRWYPDTLGARIRSIHKKRDRFTFVSGDGLQIAQEYWDREDVAVYFDPPYVASQEKGKRLYNHWNIDHEQLFATAARIRGDVLITYEDHEEVRNLATRHGFSCRLVTMKTTKHATMDELLIGRDLSWIDAAQDGHTVQLDLFEDELSS